MPSPHFVPSGSQGEMPAFLANATADAAEVDRAIALAERALAEGRVRAVYQPVVDARHGCRVGFHEALMRIATPTGGFLSPAQFLPALAGTDLAADLDLAVLDQALTMLAENPTARISVNVAAASVRTPAWMDRLIAAAGARPDVPFRLIVEIAEDNETLNGSDWAGFLASVAQLGVTTAIDDFGAGATGFEQLRQHRFDVLKIDGSYGDGLARCPQARALVRAMVSVAEHFEMLTVIEHIDSPDDAMAALDLGVDALQGYLYARPTPTLSPPFIMPRGFDPSKQRGQG